MKVTRFDPRRPLILVRGRVYSARRSADASLVLDTGAAVTTLKPEFIDRLGYSARDGEAITTVRSAVAEEPGYMLRVDRFQALGHQLDGFQVNVHDLPEGYGIDGLLGLNFLRYFKYEIHSAEGRIRTERIEQ